MAKATSKAVAESEKRRGITSTSVKLEPEERALWDEMAEKWGGRKASLVKALEVLKHGPTTTKADVIAWIERHG